MAYDEEHSRPARTCVLYLMVLGVIAVTLFFGNELSAVRVIVVTILSTIFTGVIYLK
jgi:hypothetical protein